MTNDIHIKTADDIIYHLVRDPIRLIVDELVMIEVEFIIVIISRKLVNFIRPYHGQYGQSYRLLHFYL